MTSSDGQTLHHPNEAAVPKDELDLEECAPVSKPSKSEENGPDIRDLDSPYSAFTIAEKRFIIFLSSLSALFPPLSSSVYYPVITTLARDLNVSVSDINLTVTVYLILQGLTPSLIGNFSDKLGRRPATIVCFAIYIPGCIGAALKNNYGLLMGMRCVQSIGSSSIIAVSLATASDIVTSAERGKYTSYVQIGWMIGPTIAPVIGGLLSQHLGWRSIFWFLTIFASVVLVLVLLVLPETSRNIVGNGTISPQKWNMPFLVCMWTRIRENHKAESERSPHTDAHKASKFSIDPLSSFKMFLDKETSILLIYSGLIYASSYMVFSSMPDLFQQKYGYNTLQVSLCYLATGFGAIASVISVGPLLDWNFRRHAKRAGMEISTQKQQDLRCFPIELVRLQVSLPLLLFGGINLVAYGWTMQTHTSVAGPIIFLFLQSFGYLSAFSGFNSLIMDLNCDRSGTASAAMNMSRCWLGAGGVALVHPLDSTGGVGWLTVMIAGIWLAFSPFVFLVIRYGLKWREQKRLKMETGS